MISTIVSYRGLKPCLQCRCLKRVFTGQTTHGAVNALHLRKRVVRIQLRGGGGKRAVHKLGQRELIELAVLNFLRVLCKSLSVLFLGTHDFRTVLQQLLHNIEVTLFVSVFARGRKWGHAVIVGLIGDDAGHSEELRDNLGVTPCTSPPERGASIRGDLIDVDARHCKELCYVDAFCTFIPER